MREGIHPPYKASKVLCACGAVIETRSTRGDFHIEICSSCHPFFTGKQKILDTAGRIERFKTRYAATPAKAAEAAKKLEPLPATKKAEAKPETRAQKRAKVNAGKPKPKVEAKPVEAEEAKVEPVAEGSDETPSA